MSAKLRAFIPDIGLGDPSELALAVLFLCTVAGTYVTGAVIAVDGGWTAW